MRTWLEEIELIIPLVQGGRAHRELLMQVVTQTVTGSLRRELERFIQRKCSELNVTRYALAWERVRGHIRKFFLATNEDEYLRDEVDDMKQSYYETMASYNRRFRDAADTAYPHHSRNVDQERILLKAYARNLVYEEVAKNE